MSVSLPKNATLRDILSSLHNPESFVRQALGVMHDAAKDHGNIELRLGVTGTGKAPNYRIDRAESGDAIMALDGANHKRWADGENFSAAHSWSTVGMSKEEVANLLGEIRGYRPLSRRAKT